MELLVSLLKTFGVVPVPMLDTQSQVARARAVLEANRLGVFRVIAEAGDRGISAARVADRLGISFDGAEVLLRALAGIGYLSLKKGLYRNGSWVSHWILDPRSGLENYLSMQHLLWVRWMYLGDNIRAGRSIKDHQQFVQEHVEDHARYYPRAMRELARMWAPVMVKRIRIPQGARRLLDIGGCHGEYSRAFSRRYPALKATVLDFAGSIEYAQSIIDTEGNAETIDLRIGNALEDDLGEGWDVILVINLIHIFNPTELRQFMERCHQALAPSGALILVDQFFGVSRLRDRFVSLMSLNYYNTGGRCYPQQEVRTLLEQIGFKQIASRRLPLRMMSSIIQATR